MAFLRPPDSSWRATSKSTSTRFMPLLPTNWKIERKSHARERQAGHSQETPHDCPGRQVSPHSPADQTREATDRRTNPRSRSGYPKHGCRTVGPQTSTPTERIEPGQDETTDRHG